MACSIGVASTWRAFAILLLWEIFHPTRVGRIEGLLDDLGSAGDVDGETCVGGVAPDDLDLIGYGGGAGAVDHPHGLAAAEQSLRGGEADRAGAENDVTRSPAHRLPTTAASTRALPAGALRTGRIPCNNSPESAEKVAAPLAPNIVNCSSTGIPARVVTIQPSAQSSGIATAHHQRRRV